MPTIIKGEIINCELVADETDGAKVKRENDEMRGEIAYLKKELFKLRKLAHTISGPAPGGT